MGTRTVEGIILSRKDIGEADRLLTVFTKEEGKIKVVARGSRRIKSKLSAHIEPYSNGKYFLASGKTFDILAGAECNSQIIELTKDMELYKDLSYVFEVLNLLTQEKQPLPKIYETLKILPEKLSELESKKRQILIRYFEYKILSEIGYEPDFTKCKKCSTGITEQNMYTGSFEGIYCELCNGKGVKIEKNVLKILKEFQNSDIEKIMRIKNIEKYNNSLKTVIYNYLCDILPKIPKSQNL